MKAFQIMLRSFNDGLSLQFLRPHMVRSLSININPGFGTNDNRNANSFEPDDEFERRVFGGNFGSYPNFVSFFQKLDRIEKARDNSGMGSKINEGSIPNFLDGLDSLSTLSDGLDGKLKKTASYFEFDSDEILKDDYAFRPDMSLWPGVTYETKDLNLNKPGVRKPFKRTEFEVTTEEVLRKADFRNVRFLANFLTDVGIIIKRSKIGISAKAQRKVAREIKIALAFGLMPFTTVGTKSFIYATTMEGLNQYYRYEIYDNSHGMDDVDASQDPLQLELVLQLIYTW